MSMGKQFPGMTTYTPGGATNKGSKGGGLGGLGGLEELEAAIQATLNVSGFKPDGLEAALNLVRRNKVHLCRHHTLSPFFFSLSFSVSLSQRPL